MTKRRRMNVPPSETMRFSADEVMDYQSGIRRFASLVVVSGSDADLGAHVRLEGPVTIGRDPAVEMPLQDFSISRRHVTIGRDEAHNRYVVEDLGSTNGTRVNGARIDKPVHLSEGDKIFVGSTVIRFSYSDELELDFHEKVERLVGTDDLTGLEARRKFDASLRLEMLQTTETGQSLALLMMDMDGVKKINDTHGHHMGAFAIAEVAMLIDKFLGTHGRSCRYGGDEFMAYLPMTTRETALTLAEKIRAEVESHHFEHETVVVHPTLSIGVALHPDDAQTPENLTRRADEALYRAKAQGKNRVSE